MAKLDQPCPTLLGFAHSVAKKKKQELANMFFHHEPSHGFEKQSLCGRRRWQLKYFFLKWFCLAGKRMRRYSVAITPSRSPCHTTVRTNTCLNYVLTNCSPLDPSEPRVSSDFTFHALDGSVRAKFHDSDTPLITWPRPLRL